MNNKTEKQPRRLDTIETKCDVCGAWYETEKQRAAFEEEFICDCGAKMKFNVPAAKNLPTLIIPKSNEHIVAILDPDARLDTGMKVGEAIQRASAWWEGNGRSIMQTELKRQATQIGGPDNGAGGAFASNNVDSLNFLPSGVIQGKPWEALTDRECVMIVKAWHHFNVRNPDLIGEDPRITHKMQDRDKVQ